MNKHVVRTLQRCLAQLAVCTASLLLINTGIEMFPRLSKPCHTCSASSFSGHMAVSGTSGSDLGAAPCSLPLAPFVWTTDCVTEVILVERPTVDDIAPAAFFFFLEKERHYDQVPGP